MSDWRCRIFGHHWQYLSTDGGHNTTEYSKFICARCLRYLYASEFGLRNDRRWVANDVLKAERSGGAN
jgi:hypothetical protein